MRYHWLIILLSSSLSISSSGNGQDVAGLLKTRPSSGRFVKTDRGYMVPYRRTIITIDPPSNTSSSCPPTQLT